MTVLVPVALVITVGWGPPHVCCWAALVVHMIILAVFSDVVGRAKAALGITVNYTVTTVLATYVTNRF